MLALDFQTSLVLSERQLCVCACMCVCACAHVRVHGSPAHT